MRPILRRERVVTKAALRDFAQEAAVRRFLPPQQFVAQMTLMKYGRQDELQSDALGVRFMTDAGYDPRALIDVMDILAKASGDRPRGPEFSSTHPDPGNRKAVIENAIRERFPNGVEGVSRGRTTAGIRPTPGTRP